MKCIGSHGVIAQVLAQNKAAGLAFSNAVKSIAGDELTIVVVKAEPLTESEIEHAAGVAPSASTSSGGYVIEEWQPQQQFELIEISDDEQGGVQGDANGQLELEPKNEPNEQAGVDLTPEIRPYGYLLDLQEAALQSSEEGEAESEEQPGRGRLPTIFRVW